METPSPAGDDLPARLRLALRQGLKDRDSTAVSALRSALSAISNAEAVEPGTARATPGGNQHIAGAVAGLGAGEAQRRHLSGAEIDQIIQAEISERHRTAGEYDRAGHGERAGRLRREAAVLESVRST